MCKLDFNPVSCPFVQLISIHLFIPPAAWFQSSYLSICHIWFKVIVEWPIRPGALFDCHISCSLPRWLQIFCWGKNSRISLSLRGKPLSNSLYHNKTCSLPWKARNHKSTILIVILWGTMFRCHCTICDLSPKLPLIGFCVATMKPSYPQKSFH